MDIIEAERVKKEQKRDELSQMVPKISEKTLNLPKTEKLRVRFEPEPKE